MFIYKITNTKNNKAYTGHTVRPIRQRFLIHIADALRKRLVVLSMEKNFYYCKA